MKMNNQDTGKNTVFEITQIVGDPTLLIIEPIPNDASGEAPQDTNVNTNQQVATTEKRNPDPSKQKFPLPIKPNKYTVGLILFGSGLISAMAALYCYWHYKNFYVL